MSNGVNDATIDEVVDAAREARDHGLDALWVPQIFGHDSLTVLAIAGREVPDIELGTAVVPVYTRHPMMLAQQSLTVNEAVGGRLVLGIGLSHKVVVESMWGLSYEHAARYMREYLGVLVPMMTDGAVSRDGEVFRVHAQCSLPQRTPPTVVVAALGETMLRVAGRLADGTSTWAVGPQTLERHIVPIIRQAAADAGRAEPRIVCSLPTLVTDDVDGARAKAGKIFAAYSHIPSYRAMLDVEGVDALADVAVVGDESSVIDQLDAFASLGVTDFDASVFTSDPDERERTLAVLSAFAQR